METENLYIVNEPEIAGMTCKSSGDDYEMPENLFTLDIAAFQEAFKDFISKLN